MDGKNFVEVESNIETISCDGGQDSLGHPTVYYTFSNETNDVICSYCGKIFKRKVKEK